MKNGKNHERMFELPLDERDSRESALSPKTLL